LPLSLFGSEAIAAIDRAITFGLEWHASWQVALGAIHLGGSAGIFAVALNPHENAAIWATLWFVNESFCAEEFLLSARKNERLAAISTS
jgi:hypothetical protein